MKIELTSEVTGKKYTGENYNELLAQMSKDDAEFHEAEAKRFQKEVEEKAEKAKAIQKVDAEKRELCKTIEVAKKDIENARENRIAKEKEAQEYINKAIQNVQEGLKKARQDELECRKKYADLLDEYERKYNRSYTRFLTGKEAEEEFNKFLKEFNDFLWPFSSFFN